MTLFEFESAVNQIVRDLKKAKMHKHRGIEEIWPLVEHALDTAVEAARRLEEGWGGWRGSVVSGGKHSDVWDFRRLTADGMGATLKVLLISQVIS